MSAAASATRASSIRRKRSWRGPRSGCSGRCAGSRPAAKASSPTTRAAIISPTPNWRSIARGDFLALRVRHARQSRRLCVDVRRRDSERDLQRAARGRLSNAGDLRREHRRVHQHDADRCLPRRRSARGLLRPGTPGGSRGRQAEHRSRRDPPPQPHSADGDAVQDADRADLRLRRFSASCSSASLELGDVSGICNRRRSSASKARRAARLRHGVLRRILRRRADTLCRRARRAGRIFRSGQYSRRTRRRGARGCSAPTITAKGTRHRLHRS